MGYKTSSAPNMDLMSEYFQSWTDDGYTVMVRAWAPKESGLYGTDYEATVTVEGLVPTERYCSTSASGVLPGPYLDAQVTVSYDPEDRRVEVTMIVGVGCDALTLGCNGESVAEHILTAMSRHVWSRGVRHQRCLDLAIQLVKSINSNHGPNAY